MCVLVVIVTYYPKKDLLLRNLQAYIDEVDKVLIWENTPEIERYKYRFINDDKVEYHGDGVNSISHGLNYAWNYARENGYDYLLTMDQDSVLEDGRRYLRTSMDFLGMKHKIGLIGPLINSYVIYNLIIPLGDNEHLITSAMLVPVCLLNQLGGYCEDFVIDGVDIDICIRARLNGYDIYKNTNGVLHQIFGKPYERTLFGKKYIGSNYDQRRLYSIFFSHMLLYRRYKCAIASHMLMVYFKHFIPRIIFWEGNKMSKILAIFNGIKDGLTNTKW